MNDVERIRQAASRGPVCGTFPPSDPLARVVELMNYYISVNLMWMREFDRTGQWPGAASEDRRFEEQLRECLAGNDPLADVRTRSSEGDSE